MNLETLLLRATLLLGAAFAGSSGEGLATAAVKAFPTAEGFGANTIGGRGGRVIHVTNLNDSGPGSFRTACEASGPRIVVFDVSGTINGSDSYIMIRNPYITIAGQTSPGGIQLKGNGIIVYSTHDVILRHLRIRPGAHLPVYEDTNGFIAWGVGGRPPGVDSVIVDHCSFEWSTDQNGPDCIGWVTNFTSQWNITAAGTNDGHSYGPGFNHNKGCIIDGSTMTYHHSLLAHCNARTPMVARTDVLDWRNNIVYDWQANDAAQIGCWDDNGAGQRSAFVNNVNNLYLSGINSGLPYYWLINGGPTRVDGSPAERGGTKIYTVGTWGPNCPAGSAEDWDNGFKNLDYYMSGVNPSYQPLATQAQFRSLTPFPAPAVTTHPTATLKSVVLPAVGACKPYRDAVDAQYINDVLNLSGDGNKIGTGGPWPDLSVGAPPAPLDTDQDGMPNTWELAHGLNPNNAADGAVVSSNGYTNVENYINELAGDFDGGPGRPRYRSDFNGDRKADLLFRHPSGGQVVLWIMN